MSFATGTRLGPYEVLAPLGAGGMGEVYRARDTRLDRDVALKVLPEEFFEDTERRERFEREAKALAAVNHPNIAAIYSFEEVSGRYLLVQELLEGETLREIVREGPVPPRKAIDYGAQIADGLAAAHSKGIVHRDLKPENVIVTKDGRVKILDFGLVRQMAVLSSVETNSPTEAKRTTPGEVLGTVGYLAPEQVRGLPADARTDIFALGCVLYELLSGTRAFRHETAAETMTAVLREEPPALTASPEMSALVFRCLEKNPETRFQSAQDLAFALRSQTSAPGPPPAALPVTTRRPALSWLIAGAAAFVLVAVVIGVIRIGGPLRSTTEPPRPMRIVVLPFENLGAPEDAYFADGMTEEITSRLASVKSLAVISRTTATQYDRKGKSVEQIGKDLGVGYVLEGAVRWDRSGGGPGRVRITPQLIRASDDTHLWSDRYDRQLADVFAIQGDVADGVVRAMNLTLAPAEATALRKMPTRDLEAYDLYLRALELERRHLEPSALAGVIRLSGEAVRRDPEFAEALALLARARIFNFWQGYDARTSELERARVEVERAVSLRSEAAETHLALGYYYYQGRRDYEAALREFDKALATHPNDALVHAAIAYVLRRQGRMDDAEAEFRKAIEFDPGSVNLFQNIAETQVLMRRYPEAIRNYARAASLKLTLALVYADWAWTIVLESGDVAASEEVLKKGANLPGLEDPNGSESYYRVRTALLARDWARALDRLAAERRGSLGGDLQLQSVPASLLRAEILSYAGRSGPAREAYQKARSALAANVASAPGDARLHSALGIALAGLGEKAAAVREGERGVELMGPARDAFSGPVRIEDLALILTMAGNQDAAIRQLEWLLSHPSWISVPLLRRDPRWDPLRKNPKFEALLARYETKP